MAETGWFLPRRLPGHLGAFGLARLLIVQLVLFGILLGVAHGTATMVIGGVLGGLLLVITLGRLDGLWWTECAGIWLRFWLRRSPADCGRADPRLVRLRQLSSGLSIENVSAGEMRLGMGCDRTGWFALLEFDMPGPDECDPPIPMAALARIAADTQQPGVVFQLITQSTPIGRASDAASLGSVGGHRQAQSKRTWFAVRLDAQAVAVAAIDDPERRIDPSSELAEILRRVERILRRRGLVARILDAEQMLTVLAQSCDLLHSDRATPARETWKGWHSSGLSYACFWLRRWPTPERGMAFLAALSEMPGVDMTISLVLEPRDRDNDLRCLVRIGAPHQQWHSACANVVALAKHKRVGLRRLDGEQALAVYASMPSGGGAR